MKFVGAVLLGLAFCASSAQAKLVTKMVEYKDGDEVLEGYLSYDDKGKNRPVVVVVHDWMGLADQAKKYTDRSQKKAT